MAGSLGNTGQWFEPETPYATIKGQPINPRNNASKSTVYPFNKVTETESGHVVEFDDTPGAERINIFHRSGSFEEYHPNGDKVDKIVRDQYVSVLRDSNVHIDGFHNVTVDKGLKIYVNRDNLQSSQNSAVNFDVHVGQNSNVNLYIEKGNCNVRLVDGDYNLQLNKGDMNLLQDRGNFNHFINGDYNLECTGHMHTVIGRDKVTEIGGCRDTRVDGFFDNLHVVNGYKETLVEKGDHRLQVGGGSYEMFMQNHETRVLLARISEILGTKDETVAGAKNLIVGGVNTETIAGANATLIGGASRTIVGGTNHQTTGGTLDVSVGGALHQSASTMSINGGGSIIASAGTIHFNGPPAKPATPASPITLTTKKPIYVPGAPGVWIPSVPTHTVSPLGILQNTVFDLNGALRQVSVLQAANNALAQTIAKLNEGIANLTAPIDAIGGAVTENLNGTLSLAQSATEQASSLGSGIDSLASGVGGSINSALGAVSSATTGLVGGVTGAVTGAVSGISDAISGPTGILAGGSGLIDGIKGVAGGIGSIIGDVIDAVVEIGCAIGEFINGLINAILKPILDTINAVFAKISEILGKISEFIGGILNTIGQIIGDILGAINAIIAAIIDAAGKFIGGIAAAIGGILNSFFDGFKNIGCGDGILNGNPPDLGTDAIPGL